jgi:beta-glucosidase
VPYTRLSPEIVAGPEHAELALRAARESIVLLKNREASLPLRESDRYMIVCGPHAASVEALLGNYFGMSPRMSTVLEGLAGQAPERMRIDYRKGCQTDRPNANPIDWCTFEAAQSDVVVAAMGIDPNIEGEEGDSIQSEHKGDRIDSALPQNQIDFVEKIARNIAEKKTGARLVVLLFGGSPLSVPEIHEAADAVLQVWYPGQAGGDAIAEILFGKASPCGRMPVTVPYRIEDLPDYDNYNMAGRTYKYMDPAKMLYPFGFGLSYTTFRYGALEVSKEEIGVSEQAEATLVVENTGAFEASETVQLYLSPKEPLPEDPAFRFVGVQKVSLGPGERTTVGFSLPGTLLHRFTEEGKQVPAFGTHLLQVGGALPVQRSRELGAGVGLTTRIRLK